MQLLPLLLSLAGSVDVDNKLIYCFHFPLFDGCLVYGCSSNQHHPGSSPERAPKQYLSGQSMFVKYHAAPSESYHRHDSLPPLLPLSQPLGRSGSLHYGCQVANGQD